MNYVVTVRKRSFKIKKLCLVFGLFSIVVCGFAQAAFTTDLVISGEADIEARDPVRLVSAQLVSTTDGALETYNPMVNLEETSFFLNLPSTAASAIYEVEAVNETGVPYVISAIDKLVPTEKANFEILGESPYVNLAAGEHKKFQVKVTNVASVGTEVALQLKYTFVEDIVTPPGLTISSTAWVATEPSVAIKTAGTATSGVKNYEWIILESTMTPSGAMAVSGITANGVTVSEQGEHKVYYRTVSNYNTRSVWSAAVTAKYDPVEPVVTMLSSDIYDSTKTDKIGTATFGPSNGSVTCKDNYGQTISTLLQAKAIGALEVTCTAKSGAGKTVSAKANYIMNLNVNGNNSILGCMNSGNNARTCSISGTSMVYSPGHVQFGPYIRAAAGCYHVEYFGSNFVNQGGNILAYSTQQAYTLRSLAVSGTKISYYINIPAAATNLEIVLHNTRTSGNFTINRLQVTKVNSCPAN